MEDVTITITYSLKIDGQNPTIEKLLAVASELTSDSQYIGSESIDGTDKWGLEVLHTDASVNYN